MNVLKLINDNILRLKEFDKLSESNIYNRCNIVKFKDIEDNINENDRIIGDIQGVLGFEEWESLINKNSDMISMLSRFMRFITNPRRINR